MHPAILKQGFHLLHQISRCGDPRLSFNWNLRDPTAHERHPSRETIRDDTSGVRHVNTLRRMSVATFEVLVRQVLVTYMRLHPGALGTEAKEFSLADLQTFDSIKDAVEELVARKADDLLSNGFDAWVKWFKEGPLDIDLSRLALDWDETREVFQRRHVIVHHGGRVSRRYLEKLGLNEQSGPSIGSMLDVDADYVRLTLDSLLVVGIEMVQMVYERLLPEAAAKQTGFLADQIYQLLLAHRWRPAGALCEVGSEVGRKHSWPEGSMLRFKCNKWLTEKRLHGEDHIREAVLQWDTSAFHPVFKLVRFALLNETDDAFNVLPAALDPDELTDRDLRDWPILTELRDDPRFVEFLTRPD
jgi:hypothetical protein